MRERGEINIAIANYLDNYFRGYACLIRNDNKQVKHLDEIKHIIIGRWYYGLYLIAKDKLKVSAKADIKHKGYTCKKGKKKIKKTIYGIWELIDKKAKIKGINSYDFEKNGIDLFQLRNKYEYRGTNVTDTNFNLAKKIYEDMYNELQKL